MGDVVRVVDALFHVLPIGALVRLAQQFRARTLAIKLTSATTVPWGVTMLP